MTHCWTLKKLGKPFIILNPLSDNQSQWSSILIGLSSRLLPIKVILTRTTVKFRFSCFSQAWFHGNISVELQDTCLWTKVHSEVSRNGVKKIRNFSVFYQELDVSHRRQKRQEKTSHGGRSLPEPGKWKGTVFFKG